LIAHQIAPASIAKIDTKRSRLNIALVLSIPHAARLSPVNPRLSCVCVSGFASLVVNPRERT
jgi:hypothetical protein